MSSSMDKIAENFTCPICLEIPRKGGLIQCPNEHLACESCFALLPAAPRKKCPQCRLEYGKQPKSSRIAESVVDLMPFECRYKDIGCPITVLRQDLAAHEAECSFGVKLCKYQSRGCQHKADMTKIKSHENNHCKFRDIQCKHIGCKATYRSGHETEHLGACTYQKVQCPLANTCKKDIQIIHLADHLLNGHKVPLKQDRHSESFEAGQKKARFVKAGLIQSGENMFVTHLERYDDYCLACVFYLGPPCKAESLGYSVSISNPSQPEKILAMYGGVANPIIILASDNECSGLYITKDLIARFKGQEAKARVKFSVIDFKMDDINGRKALTAAQKELESSKKNLYDTHLALTVASDKYDGLYEDHQLEVNCLWKCIDEGEEALIAAKKEITHLKRSNLRSSMDSQDNEAQENPAESPERQQRNECILF